VKRASLSLLQCPACRCSYELVAHDADDLEVANGALRCPSCGIVAPIVDDFPLFTEPMLHAGEASPEKLRALGDQLLGTPTEYRAYHELKRRRGGLEIYAAFHPFNESTRAVEPLMETMAAALRPGDVILDPWCRSGWSAVALAAAFPAQQVVALWEGERSVLGYRGYAYWFARERRPANLEVMFVDPSRGLPFADGAFGAIYALDAFHRLPPAPFAGELLRVAAEHAPIVLAHLHLSNGEPEPYFERGGRHWHGRDYQAWFDQLAQARGRKGLVYSEAALFEHPPHTLPDPTPETPHYNGLAMLLGKDAVLAPPRPRPRRPDDRLLVNPLFTLHLSRRLARVEGRLHDGAVRHLLDRHPIYEQRLPKAPVQLSELAMAVIALALAGRPLNVIASALGVDGDFLEALLPPFEQSELLLRTPVGAAGVALQRFHANQIAAEEPCGPFAVLLERLNSGHGAMLSTSDGGSVSGPELYVAISHLTEWMRRAGLGPGKRLWIADAGHPLAVPVVLAGLAAGMAATLGPEVRPPDPDLVLGPLSDGAEWAVEALNESAPTPGRLRVETVGTLSMAIEGRRACFDAEALAEAALSLSAAVLPSEPLAGVAGFPELLACLTAFGSGRNVTIRSS
jgi:uncharacterized protein YbaR (Trm112 family)